MHRILRNIKSNIVLYIIIAAAFITRLIYQANYLEDWDSVQYALGIHNFSIPDHQPQPPGYPLYILLGRLSYLIFHDDTRALTFLSVFFGTLVIIPLYLLTKKMFDKKTALLSSLFFIVTPIVWILSEVALTDIPGLFFLIFASFLIYNGKSKPKSLFIGSFLAGLVLGVRLSGLPILLALLVLILIRKRSFKYILQTFAFFITGLILWLLPTVIITGSKQFFDSYHSITIYIVHHDVLLGQTLPLLSLIILRIKILLSLLTISYTLWFTLAGILVIIYFITRKNLWKEFRYQFLGVWIISYLIPQLFIYNLEMPRHTLPLFPPVLILIASLISNLTKKSLIFLGFYILLLITLFLQGWSQVTRLHYQIPPSIKPILFVKKNFSPDKTIIISSLTYRHFQYYAPNYQIYNSDKISTVRVQPNQKVIIDYLPLKDKIKSTANFKITASYKFEGEKDIFPRVPKTKLYILEKSN